ncbi:MAG: amidohydrolase, partial [Pseudomonadota bacterium]
MTTVADLIVLNGRIKTMDPANPTAEAVAVSGDRIAAVGANADIEALRGPDTRVVDAAGASVLPGIVEAHMHLFPGAADARNLQLAHVKGFDALKAAVDAYVATHPGSDLVIGNAADYTILNDEANTTRHDLDRILPDRPLMLVAPDYHTAWANTIALETAGILNGRALSIGNEIVMGPDGLATGALHEGEAMDPVADLSPTGGRERLGLRTGGNPDPPATREEREIDKTLLREGLAHCAENGITSIHNMDGNRYQLDLLAEIEAEGDLICRVQVPFHFKNFMPVENLDEASELTERFNSDWLKCGRVKLFMDGVLDSGTAVMVGGYGDDPDHNCDPLFTQDQFNAVAVEADRRGLQIAVHAIGDGAVRMVLNGYQAARTANGARDARHRIEHIEVVHPDDIPRFAEMGVICSMQPPHAPGTDFPPEPTISKIGRHRWPYSYAWRTLRDAGARFAFASDWPVSPVDPFLGISCGMKRAPWGDEPDQSLTLDELIQGYTADGAYTEFMEDRKGMLKPGYYADVVVMTSDLDA